MNSDQTDPIRVHSVCLHDKIRLECIWIDAISRQPVLHKNIGSIRSLNADLTSVLWVTICLDIEFWLLLKERASPFFFKQTVIQVYDFLSTL